MAKYQTEKRKANVGERILITNASLTGDNYKNGDVRTVSEVISDIGLRVVEHHRGIYHSEYEVIVEPTKNARITALETELALLKAKVEALEKAAKYPLTARFNAETNAEADRIMAEIKRKATPQTPNEQRADVINRAKAFVGEGFNRWFGNRLCTVEFIVNSEKRTVVALLWWKPDNRVLAKGIAKCDPDDVFNADIGKAIALARALGVEVPVEFVKAVQPTEVVVGQVIENTGCAGGTRKCVRIVGNNVFRDNGFSIEVKYAKIIEDTEAVYE